MKRPFIQRSFMQKTSLALAMARRQIYSGHMSKSMVPPDRALPGRAEAWFAIPEQHAVLGSSLEGPWAAGTVRIYLAMGCFWGAEEIYWRLPGVVSTSVGYMGGYSGHPSYEEVCSGMTGHTETASVTYDPAVISDYDILKVFWENHDPTQGYRQGNDIGTMTAFGVMLFLYGTGIVKVGSKFKKVMFAALISYGLIGIVSLIASLFGVGGGWGFYGVSGIGLLLCAAGVLLASFTLLLDFDAIKEGIAMGLPEKESWRMAFGLELTLIWLYLEILRLLAIVSGRD